MKIKKGDQIIVTIGKDKGRKGKVDRVLLKKKAVLVPGVNMYKRHTKPKDEKQQGGIIDMPRALPLSKVAIICKSCGKQTRVGYLISKTGKERVCRKCNHKI